MGDEQVQENSTSSQIKIYIVSLNSSVSYSQSRISIFGTHPLDPICTGSYQNISRSNVLLASPLARNVQGILLGVQTLHHMGPWDISIRNYPTTFLQSVGEATPLVRRVAGSSTLPVSNCIGMKLATQGPVAVIVRTRKTKLHLRQRLLHANHAISTQTSVRRCAFGNLLWWSR